MLSRDELAALATSVYGSEWQTRLARERGVNPRTVRDWAKDGIAKPATAVGVRAFLLSRRVIDLPPPLSDDDDERDEAAHTVVPVVLDQVVEAGRAVGWSDAELLAASLSWCVDRMAEGAGVPTTIEAIQDGLAQLRGRIVQ